MKTGILGGSFNPVHFGHLSIAKAACDEIALDKIIFMPAFRHPFGNKSYGVGDEHRLNMLRLAVSDMQNAEVSDFEIKKGDVSYTIETLNCFRQKYRDAEIVFVQGTDTFLTLDKWYCFEEILRTYTIAVGTRPNYRTDELEAKIAFYRERFASKIIRLNNVEVNVSSTELREKLSSGADLCGLMPPRVEEYIRENGLYREE